MHEDRVLQIALDGGGQHRSSRKVSQHETPRPLKFDVLSSLERPISPPLRRRNSQLTERGQPADPAPSMSAVESGQSSIHDSLSFFSTKILCFSRPSPSVLLPRISYEDWVALYKRNQGKPHGRHFVIHQRDHPVSRTHYDLRVQCNEVSSLSWAIMYGMPGDPNSVRLNRGAVETRIHCLWNHLIETASHSTGSMLIWDTGEYSNLPYYTRRPDNNDNSTSASDERELDAGTGFDNSWSRLTDSEKLRLSFSNGKIRMQLHGSRLPAGYTLGIRLDKGERHKSTADQPQKPSRKRRRFDPKLQQGKRAHDERGVESEEDTPITTSSPSPSNTHKPSSTTRASASAAASPEDESESETIRLANAYPGAINDVGSIHQRRWYLSLDRDRSGFHRRRNCGRSWIRKSKDQGFEPFHVMGRDVERSVVTGRLGQDILEDEGIDSYIPRRRWRPVME